MAGILKQSSTAQPLLFLLVSSTDHITGVTGLTPTVRISKNGGTGAAPSGAVSEVDATNMPGWYKVAGNATDTATLGPLILHATGTGADPVDERYEVVAFDPQLASMGLSLAKGTNLTGLNDIAATAVVSGGAITTSGGAVSTVTTLTGHTPQTGDNYARIGAAGAGLTALGDTRLANLDASVSSRSTFAGGAVASVTGNVGGSVNGNVVGSVGSVTGAVGSVTGAVGSVTGNVGGNVVGSTASVTGSVGSVAGAVGSVAGDVGGKVLGGGVGTIAGDGVRAASVTGSVGSVTGAVGSVTGSVGSVTGNVGGNVVGSVGSVTTVSDKTGYVLSAAGVDAIWDEPKSGHVTAGTYGAYLDASVSGVSTGGVSATDIAAQVRINLATELGRIDVATSTRAAASTALTNATWTDAKAGYLDAAVSSVSAGSAPTVAQIRQEMDANSTRLANLDATVSSRAAASTALSTAVWTGTKAGYLDAAVSSVSGGGGSLTAADVWAHATRTLSDKTGFSINLSQAGLSPRALDSVADAALTVGDALVAAISGAAGKESVSGTSYAVKTPSTGTVIRTFVLDSATAPTSRS